VDFFLEGRGGVVLGGGVFFGIGRPTREGVFWLLVGMVIDWEGGRF